MSRIWKSILGYDRKPDPKAVEMLEQSQKELDHVHSQAPVVNSVSGYLAARRQQNHFGDALTISFTPRSNHA